MWLTILEIILATSLRIILNTLFIHCFLPFNSRLSKKEIVQYLLHVFLFWVLFELVRGIIENTILTVTYDGFFVFVNTMRSIAMMYSVTILFKGRFGVRVLLTFLWISLSGFWEGVQQLLYDKVFQFENYISFIMNGFAWTGSNILEVISIWLMKTFREKGIYLPRKIVAIQTALVLFSFLNFGIRLVSVTISKSNGSLKLGDFLLNLLSALFVIVFHFLFELTNKIQRKNQVYKLKEQRHYFLEEYYRNIELNQNEVRKIKHDMNNQLLSIKGQLSKDSTEEAKNQIQEFLNQLE